MRLLIFLATIAVLASALSSAQAPSASNRFDALLDEDWKYWMSQYPETATALGYPGHDARWTDYSPAAIDARARRICASTTRAHRRHRSRRGSQPADQLELRPVSRHDRDARSKGSSSRTTRCRSAASSRTTCCMPINQMEGVQQDIPRIISLMPAGDGRRLREHRRAPRRACRRSSIRRSR